MVILIDTNSKLDFQAFLVLGPLYINFTLLPLCPAIMSCFYSVYCWINYCRFS